MLALPPGSLWQEPAGREIDRICDAFERDWLAAVNGSAPPRLELFLEQIDPPLHPDLLRELLELERHYRLKTSTPLPVENYLNRFSPFAGVVEEVFSGPANPLPPEAVPSTVDDAPASLADPAPSGSRGGEARPAQARPHGPPGLLGPYQLLRELGAGGMGKVYAGEDPVLNRPVALKVMKPEIARFPNARARFLREARVVAGIDHENIVPVFQVSEHEGTPYIVMPLLRGETLEARPQRDKAIPWREAVALAVQAAEGLAVAHGRGLIHRDVKPANLWLEPLPPERQTPVCPQRVKLLDFGLAYAGENEVRLTQSGMMMGTPGYLAPEQARGEKVTLLADLFSLGCVLYRMVTGTAPFAGPNIPTILRKLAKETPRSTRELNPDIPPALDRLIADLLAKDPAARPVSAAEVVKRLGELEAPVQPKALPKPAPRPARPSRRRPLQIAAAAAIAVASVGLCVVIIIKQSNGKTVAEVTGPPGIKVDVEKDKIVATLPPEPPTPPVTTLPKPPPVIPTSLVPPKGPLRPANPFENSVNDFAVGWDGTRWALSCTEADFAILRWERNAWMLQQHGVGTRVIGSPGGDCWHITGTGDVYSNGIHRWRRDRQGGRCVDLAISPTGKVFALGGPEKEKEGDDWPVLIAQFDDNPGVDIHRRTTFRREPTGKLKGVRLAVSPRNKGTVVTIRSNGDLYFGPTHLVGVKAFDVAASGTGSLYVLPLEPVNAAGEHSVLAYDGDYQTKHAWRPISGPTGVRIAGDFRKGFWLLNARGEPSYFRDQAEAENAQVPLIKLFTPVPPKRPLRPTDLTDKSVNDFAIGRDGTRWALSCTDTNGFNFGLLRWEGKGWKPHEPNGVRIGVDNQGNLWQIVLDGVVWSQGIVRWDLTREGGPAVDLAFAPNGTIYALGGPPEGDDWPVLIARFDDKPGVKIHDRTSFPREPTGKLKGVRIDVSPRGKGTVVTIHANGDVSFGPKHLVGVKAFDLAASGDGALYVLALEPVNAAGERTVLAYAGDYETSHVWRPIPGLTGVRIVADPRKGFWLLNARGEPTHFPQPQGNPKNDRKEE